MLRLATVLFLLAASLAPASAETYRTYANPRFGATADVPSDWRSEPPPENGDGLTFTSPDGTASVTVYGSLNIEDNAQTAMQRALQPSEGETITYRQSGKDWVVVSGVKGSQIFYHKSILVCRDQIWNDVDLEYPAARKSAYDALVTHIASSLHFSGRSGQIPNCR
ncbi:MAG TPA: hypothetical protein VKS78_04630 [Roseiarcus sp.]|nr:hypothetical protein [Roseiarcus sp.]